MKENLGELSIGNGVLLGIELANTRGVVTIDTSALLFLIHAIVTT